MAKLTVEAKEKIIKLLESGYSVSAVKDILGHSWGTIKKCQDERLGHHKTRLDIIDNPDKWNDVLDDYRSKRVKDKVAALEEQIALVDLRIKEKLERNDGFTLSEAVTTFEKYVGIRYHYGKLFQKQSQLDELPFIIDRVKDLMDEVKILKNGK